MYQVNVLCEVVRRCEVKSLMAAVELQRHSDRPALAVVAALRNNEGEEKIFKDILKIHRYSATGFC
jgi:hypothetical protein